MNHNIQPLSNEQISLIRLIEKGKQEHGWTPVSTLLLPLILETMPDRLISVMELEDKTFVKLTIEGTQISNAMPWLGL